MRREGVGQEEWGHWNSLDEFHFFLCPEGNYFKSRPRFTWGYTYREGNSQPVSYLSLKKKVIVYLREVHIMCTLCAGCNSLSHEKLTEDIFQTYIIFFQLC